MKKLTLVNAAVPDSAPQDYDIEPGSTAGDLLKGAGYDPAEYSLKRPGSEQVMAAEENLYALPNGSKVFVTTKAGVGGFFARFFGFADQSPSSPKVKPSVTGRAAPSSLPRKSSTPVSPKKARLTISPDSRPYWEQHFWQHKNGHLHGSYKCGRRAYHGKVDVGALRFYVQNPPKEVIREGAPHAACFRARKDGWYEIHFSIFPTNEHAGIIAVEGILAEAHR